MSTSGNSGCKLIIIGGQAVSTVGGSFNLVAAPIDVRDHQKQHFSVLTSQDGSIIIHHLVLRKVFDVTGHNTAPGTPVNLWDSNNQGNQKWTLTPEKYLKSQENSQVAAYLGFGANGRLVITNQPTAVELRDGIDTVGVTLANYASVPLNMQVRLIDNTTRVILVPPFPTPPQEFSLDIGATIIPVSDPPGTEITPNIALVRTKETFKFTSDILYPVTLVNQTLQTISILVDIPDPEYGTWSYRINLNENQSLVQDLESGSTIEVLYPQGVVIYPVGKTTVTKAETIIFSEEAKPPVNIVLRNSTIVALTITTTETPAKVFTLEPGAEISAILPLGVYLNTVSSDNSLVAPASKRVKRAETVHNTSGWGSSFSGQDKTLLRLWLPQDHTTVSSLYQATRDGFHYTQLHSKACGKGPCVLIITTPEGYKFGGYAPLGFQSNLWGNYSWTDDPATNFFSLVNPSNNPRNFPVINSTKEYKRAYTHIIPRHPGWANGLFISDNGKTLGFWPEDNSTLLPSDPLFFTGKTSSNISEIEVYKVLFQ